MFTGDNFHSRRRRHDRANVRGPAISPFHRTTRAWSENGVQFVVSSTSFSIPGFSLEVLNGEGVPTQRRVHPLPGQEQSQARQSPIHRLRGDWWFPSHPSRPRQPQGTMPRSTTQGRSERDHEQRHERLHRTNMSSGNERKMIEALENTVEVERRAIRRCKQRLAQVSREEATRAQYLQSLVNDLKRHEDAFKRATDNLTELRNEQNGGIAQQQPPPPPPRHRTFVTEDYDTSGLADEEVVYSSPTFNFVPLARETHRRGSFLYDCQHTGHFDPFSGTAFDNFERLFGDLHSTFFAGDTEYVFPTEIPFTGATRRHARRASNGMPHSRPTPPSTASPPVSKAGRPPANLLTPDEAAQWYEKYNACWSALSPTEPKVPFPARGLQAVSLAVRDSIWAPNVTASVSSWSEEAVMQANVQAFFLGAVGLTPKYREITIAGRVEMGFDRSQASPTQVKSLIDILKKEKTRWHSDRLGRRNGHDRGGTNEGLQKDSRSRAVFHAVCELMESAL